MPDAGRLVVPFSVTIDGRNISDRLNRYLIAIEVEDKDGVAADSCRITLDDSNGQLVLPAPGCDLSVDLDGALVFAGMLDEIKSQGARGQGRLLTINGRGFDPRARVKAPLDFHMDDATFQEFMDKATKLAGLESITVSEEYRDIKRDYWSADNESYVHLLERMSLELGATAKIRKDKVVFASRNTGTTPAGTSFEKIKCEWAKNLIAWDVSPYIARPRHEKATVEWFDRKKQKWERETDVTITYPSPDDPQPAETLPAYTAHDKETAKRRGKGKRVKAVRESGEGTLKLLLCVDAHAEGIVTLIGTRNGVDGDYVIASVKHTYTRTAGSQTDLTIKRPSVEKDELKGAGGESGPPKETTNPDTLELDPLREAVDAAAPPTGTPPAPSFK